jgi:hypothetical protein
MVEHFPTDGQGSYIASALAPKLIDFVLSSSFDRREEAVFWWRAARPLLVRTAKKQTFVQAMGQGARTPAVGEELTCIFRAATAASRRDSSSLSMNPGRCGANPSIGTLSLLPGGKAIYCAAAKSTSAGG